MDWNKLREELADSEHERWSRWMNHLFEISKTNLETNEVIIPKELVIRWKRQVATPYSVLSEPEKDSDRKEADRTIKIFKEYL